MTAQRRAFLETTLEELDGPTVWDQMVAEHGDPLDPPRYYRSRDGLKIHTADCPRKGATAVVWPFGQHLPHDTVMRLLDMSEWASGCQHCMTNTT